MTKERITKFLDTTHIEKTVFCKLAGISQSMLRFYMLGERNLSKKMDRNINSFMDNYIEKVKLL